MFGPLVHSLNGCNARTPSWTPILVAGTQVLEPLSAAIQHAHQQEAESRVEKLGLDPRYCIAGYKHPKQQLKSLYHTVVVLGLVRGSLIYKLGRQVVVHYIEHSLNRDQVRGN